MPIHAAEQHPSLETPSVGEAAKQVAGHAGTLAKLGIELARLEVKSKAGALGLGVGAALVALYGLGFLFATIAVALAIVLDAWLALLLVTLSLFTLAGNLGSLARARLKSGGTPSRDIVEQLKDGLSDATDVAGKLRGKLPVVAAGALGAGFFLAGGIGATMRFLARKGRER